MGAVKTSTRHAPQKPAPPRCVPIIGATCQGNISVLACFRTLDSSPGEGACLMAHKRTPISVPDPWKTAHTYGNDDGRACLSVQLLVFHTPPACIVPELLCMHGGTQRSERPCCPGERCSAVGSGRRDSRGGHADPTATAWTTCSVGISSSALAGGSTSKGSPGEASTP